MYAENSIVAPGACASNPEIGLHMKTLCRLYGEGKYLGQNQHLFEFVARAKLSKVARVARVQRAFKVIC